jgi:zinc protease
MPFPQIRSAALLLLVVIAIVLLRPARPRAASSDVLPFKATERTLANGLKVIVVPTGFPNLVSIQIPVQTGSRNEVEPGKSGFAHFFEHLMFRGTPDTPPEKYREIMGKAGARDNASTGDDHTQYYATFAKEHLERILALYADMFQNLSYAEGDFKTEARAILGEYNKNSADPIRKLLEVQREKFFTAHPYKHTTMGLIADIEDMPNEYAYSKLFFQRWYRPQFTTLVIAGDVVPDRVLGLVEKYWAGWKSGDSAPPAIPSEPASKGPKYVHVPWTSDTLPYVTVAFPSPAFVETDKDSAAMDLLAALYFGSTSDLYNRLVVKEQKLDALFVDVPSNVDPSLFTVFARLKNRADAVYVRDQILATIASARSSPVPAKRLGDAKSFSRYSFARTLDSTERIASVVAAFASYKRSFDTVNASFRTLDSLQAADLQGASRRYFTDDGLIVTTLATEPLAAGIEKTPPLASVAPAAAFPSSSAATAPPGLKPSADLPADIRLVRQKSVLPQLNVKLLFAIGSANDPAGKEGLAALTASMIAEAGSRQLPIEQIEEILYPIAGSFTPHADKEMTTFTGVIHRDHWPVFFGTVLPQLLDPGFREEDFKRLKDAQLNALIQDLRSNNEEELGKERLQTNIFRGTPYGHVALGTVAGITATTLDDVKSFAKAQYMRANLTLGINGDAPDEMVTALKSALAALPAGTPTPRVAVQGSRPSQIEVEILEKETRATAISFGFPIEVTRAHPDFAALSIARVWLGEHRLASGQLYQRIREVRGFNYGDYAYIEAFPRGMFQFFPDPNVARQRQIFEIWIRPVVPENAQMALRIAVHELAQLVEKGLTQAQFDTTRDYLMNNVYVMTARQDQQLGYALDSQWYGIGEFTAHVRKALQALTVDQVNAAIKKHLTARDLSVVVVTRNAAGLKQALVSDAFSTVKYDAPKPADLMAEDKIIGALKLGIAADKVRVIPIAEVFAR